MNIGDVNRICEVSFIPNNNVKGDAQIVMVFDGVVSVKTSLCELEYYESSIWKKFKVAGCISSGANN